MVSSRRLLVVAVVSAVVAVVMCLCGCAAVQYQRVDGGGAVDARQTERDSVPLSTAARAAAAAVSGGVVVPVGK